MLKNLVRDGRSRKAQYWCGADLGVGIAHTVIACESCLKGIRKLQVNEETLAVDLAEAWELLAEPIQTVMRRHGIDNPYEKLKALTRGRRIDQQTIRAFIEGLAIPQADKERLLALTPADYTGNAGQQAKAI